MRPILSIRIYITLMIVATVLPVLLFSGLLVHRAATNEQDLTIAAMRDAARGIASDLSRELAALTSTAAAIADARTLRTDELPAFYARWAPVVARDGLTAVVYDEAGQQLVNTSVPLGTVLPAEPGIVRAALDAGEARLSDSPHAGGGAPSIAIDVPVQRPGKPPYVLSLRIGPAIAAALDQQPLVQGQFAGLLDRRGSVIHLTRAPDGLARAQPFAGVAAAAAGREEGVIQTDTGNGMPVYVAFRQVKQAGWVLAVAMPSQLLFAPATRSLYGLIGLGGGTLLLVCAVAWIIGRGVANAVGELSRLAAALGSGERRTAPEPTHIREVNAVAAAMAAASETLHQQAGQRDRAADTLRAEAEGRQRAEQQLLQSQKMEAVGQMTGGMAHDFNNLLAIIVGSLDLLRQRWADDPRGLELADEAMGAAMRGAALTKQLLAFARRQPLRPERCDINDIIGVFVQLLSRTLGEDIQIGLHLSPGLWPVLIDRVQLEAAIANLATNARQAMPAGGRLTIRTANFALDEAYAASHPEAAAGEYVCIEVRDTCTGIPPDVLDRIFEPFFTTKPPGQGTGLGLSMVFGFMKQSGGHVAVYSEIGEGTAFRLYLPRPRGEDLDRAPAAEVPAPPPLGQGEVVLAVEDNTGLRQTLVRQLIDGGYGVLEASDARAAMDLIEGPERIDLLLTDIVMPGGMNGHELARLATLVRPALKVLWTSGFSDMASHDAPMPAEVRVLRKPYRRDDLLRVLHAALHG